MSEVKTGKIFRASGRDDRIKFDVGGEASGIPKKPLTQMKSKYMSILDFLEDGGKISKINLEIVGGLLKNPTWWDTLKEVKNMTEEERDFFLFRDFDKGGGLKDIYEKLY